MPEFPAPAFLYSIQLEVLAFNSDKTLLSKNPFYFLLMLNDYYFINVDLLKYKWAESRKVN